MLSPQAANATSSSQAAANDASTSLSGTQNVAVQGTPVPLIYGRTMCGSVVASIGYSAEDWAQTAANTAADSIGYSPVEDGLVSQGTGSGGGGKGGGTSSGAREAPNTLRSRAVVRLIDVIGEGPVTGLVGGAKGIYFNGTPLQAEDGTYNFQGVTVVERTGQPDQDPVSGFPAAEQSIALSGVQVKQSSPRTEYLNEATATAARVTIGIPALYSTDTSTGNLNPGPDIHLIVEVQPQRTGAPWVPVVDDNISGQKCTSRYQRSYRFDLPEHGQPGVTSWAVRVTRLSPDSSTASVASDLYWDAVDVITDHQLMYPGTHYVAMTFDSEAFGSTLPNRSYLVDGLQVRVPANYDTVDRTYATSGPGTLQGTWDGVSWKLATTDDPAWCLLDVLTEERYGVGLPASALETAAYELFTVSQYAAGVVPDGFGGLEHRYSLNVQITDADDAYAVLQQFVSAFRGMSYWAAGSMLITADMPAVPDKLVVPGNVINGEFRYEGTSLKTRHNVARVAWRDPGQGYRQAIEVVEDYDAIASQGQREVDVKAFGITSRGLARRLGRWLLDSEKHQTQTITYSASLDHMDLRPGEIFQVADPNYAGARLGGRLRFCTADVLQLDAVLPVNGNILHTITVTLPDGSLHSRVIVHYDLRTDGTHTAVTLDTPLPSAPAPNAIYLVTGADLEAPQFKVVRITETDRGIFEVIGLEHDPAKFDRVEYDLPFRPHTYSLLPALLAQPIPPPTNATARDYLAGVGSTTIVRVTIAWTPASSPMIRGTQVRASGPEQRLVNADGTTVDMDGLPVGSYIFSVRHVGENGRVSAWTETDVVVVDGVSDAPPAITGLTAVGGTRRVSLRWNASTIRDLLHYEVWRNSVPVLETAGRITTVDASTYADSDQDVLQPVTTWYYWVRAVTTTLALGGWSNRAQATTTTLLTDDLDASIRNTAKYAQSLLGSPDLPQVVDQLPASAVNNQVAYLTTDGKLYRYSTVTGLWSLVIPLIPNSNGKLTADQIQDIDSAQIGSQFTPEQVHAVLQALGTGNLDPKVLGQFTPEQAQAVVDALATGALSAAKLGELTAEQKAAVVASIATGSITSDQISSISAAKVSGTLTNASIQADRIYDVDANGNVVVGVSAGKLLGQVNADQLPVIPTAKLTGDILAGASASLNLASTRITGALSKTNVPALSALTGKIAYGQVDAGAVDAAAVRAGAITTAALAVGSTNNQIANSCFLVSGEGWAGTPVTPVIGTADAAFNLGGQGAGVVRSAPIAPGNIADTYFSDGLVGTGRAYDAPIPALPGECWEAQVTYSPINGSIQVLLLFVDGAGTILASPRSDETNFGPVASAPKLSDWNLVWTRPQVAPPGTVAVTMMVRFTNRGSTTVSVGGYLTRALLGQTVPNATAALPWTPGSATSITGGLLETNTIVARHMTAGSIRTAALDAGAVTAEKLAVGNSSNLIANSCFALTGEDWVVAAAAGAQAPGGLRSCSAVRTSYATEDGCGTLDTYLPAGSIIDITSPYSACAPGEVYEAQAVVLPIGSAATVYMVFLTRAGSLAGYSAFGNTVASQPIPADADQGTLVPFRQVALLATAPPTAARVAMVIRLMNPQPSLATGYAVITRTALGRTVAGATQVSAWAAGGVTTIGGGIISSQAILARHLTVGSVQAESIAVASASNVIYNPCLPISSSGWTLTLSAPGAVGGSVTGDSIAPPGYALAGEGTGCIRAASLDGAGYLAAVWAPDSASGVPCLPGEWWEAQAYVAAHRCYAQVELQFLNAGGTVVLSQRGGRVVAGGGASLSGYQLSWTKLQAPGDAAFARLIVYGLNDGQIAVGAPAGQSPYLFWTHAVLGRSSPVPLAQSTPQAYQTGGATTIDGGQMRTGAVTARVVAAGAITAEKLAVGSPSNVIWNACCEQGVYGWGRAVFGSLGAFDNVINAMGAANIISPAYALRGYGSAFSQRRDNSPVYADQGYYWDWSPTPGVIGVPATSQATYGAAASIIVGNGMVAYLQMIFLNYDQVEISRATSQTVTSNGVGNGLIEDFYQRISLVAEAPASTAIVLLRIVGQGSGTVQPFMAWSKAQLAEVPKGGRLGLWTPGGVTTINGGVLTTGSITAQQLAAASVIAGKIAAGAVIAGTVAAGAITAGTLAAGAVTAGTLAANAVQAGTIQAGAIQTADLAAGVITADRLAANSVSAANIVGGSITAGKLAAGSVITANLAAGAVTAEKLAIGSPSNLIWNSTFDQGAFGWGRAAFGGQGDFGSNPAIVMDSAGRVSTSWALTGFGSAFTQRIDNAPLYSNQGMYWDWSPTPGVAGVAAASNRTYGAAASVIGGNGGSVHLELIFLDFNRGETGRLYSSAVTSSVPNGLVEDFYTRISVVGVAPAGTAFVLLRVVMAGVGSVQPFMAFTKAQLAELPTGGQMGGWVPGGVTTIDGGVIKTNSIEAAKIVAGSLTAGQIASRTITAERIAAGTLTSTEIAANTITADNLAANSVTAGKIVAGAVGADQVAANQLYARHMAADEILTLSAQIRYGVINTAHIQDATINTAKIQDLTVNGEKIAPAAVSSVSWAASGGGSTQATATCAVQVNNHTNGILVWFRTNLHGLPTDSPGQAGGGEGNG